MTSASRETEKNFHSFCVTIVCFCACYVNMCLRWAGLFLVVLCVIACACLLLIVENANYFLLGNQHKINYSHPGKLNTPLSGLKEREKKFKKCQMTFNSPHRGFLHFLFACAFTWALHTAALYLIRTSFYIKRTFPRIFFIFI